MEFLKQCKTCEFNFSGICAGQGDTYKYGEVITNDMLYCDDWSASLDYFSEITKNAPWYIREPYQDCKIDYEAFEKLLYADAKDEAIYVNIYDAIRVYDGTGEIERFWKEVYEYIKSAYDVDKIKRINLNGGGAAWIKTGAKVLPKTKFVLDKLHMHKYIIAATSHLADSAEDARSEIYRAIHKTGKKACEEVFDRIIYATESETKRKAVETSKGYILSNWSGI